MKHTDIFTKLPLRLKKVVNFEFQQFSRSLCIDYVQLIIDSINPSIESDLNSLKKDNVSRFV